MDCRNCQKELNKADLEFGEPSGLCYECYMYECQVRDAEQSEMRQITRDMAIDAGDPSLEGQWIEW